MEVVKAPPVQVFKVSLKADAEKKKDDKKRIFFRNYYDEVRFLSLFPPAPACAIPTSTTRCSLEFAHHFLVHIV